MKKTVLPLLLLTLLAAFAFKGNKESTYEADLAKSGMTWEARKVIGGHNGMISLKEGHITCNDNHITGGSFSIDMASLHVLDLEGKSRERLEGHLKSPDFFEANKYPYALFEIRKVVTIMGDSAMATGALTIRDSTREISFPVICNIKGKRAEITATNVKIDRTQFGVKYASKSIGGAIGDKAIDDIFTIGFSVVLMKKGS